MKPEPQDRPKPNLKAEGDGREVFGFQCSVFSRAVRNEHATLPFPLSGFVGGVLSL